MATKKNAESKELVLEQEAAKDSKKVSTKKVSTKKPVEKALKVTKKATEKAEEQVEEKKSTEVTKAPKKTVAKKTKAKKTVTKKATAKKEEENPMDKFFPKELEVDGTKFSRVKIESWEEFKKFVTDFQDEDGLHVVIACNWPKKYKKIYDENNQGEKLFPKDGFKYDLDFQEVLMLQQTRETAITVSILTESVVLFREEYFELTDFGYFLENGMPFMVYVYSDAK